MYKVINNKRYNTDSAKKLIEWDNGMVDQMMEFYSQELYRKKSGEYFLLSEGGAKTVYAEAVGVDSWQGGSRIDPMTYDEARKWAEEHASAKVFEECFGVPEEGTCFVTVEISNAAKSKLDAAKSKSGKTQADIIENLLLGL
jgi:hypothetical protein